VFLAIVDGGLIALKGGLGVAFVSLLTVSVSLVPKATVKSGITARLSVVA
jgi:hypothetical protein